LNRLLLILSLFCCGPLIAYSQQTTPPGNGLPTGSVVPSTGKSILSNYQRQARARKDSALAAGSKYLVPGKPLPSAGGKPVTRDTLPAHAVKRAEEDASEADILIPSLDRHSCKSITLLILPRVYDKLPVTKDLPSVVTPLPPPVQHVPFLQVHGNVLYNLNYYSRVDTPYSERDVYQHTLQTWLDVVIKGQYPMRIYLTNRWSNSPLFRNFSDLNLSYNSSRFEQGIKDQVRRAFLQSIPGSKTVDSLQRLLNSYLQKLGSLEGRVKNPGLVQKMVEAREQSLYKMPAGKDSSAYGGKSDSIAASVQRLDSLYTDGRREADSLRGKIAELRQLLRNGHQLSQSAIDRNLREIERAGNPDQLRRKMQGIGMSDSSLPKGYKTLMAIKSFSVGRTIVNYSELSVKNISINGVQAEYNPSAYFAVASGSVDYRFRDFIVQGPGQTRQYLNVVRVGKGLRERNGLILTYFTGRRQLYNSVTSDTQRVQVPSSSLMGLTLEGNYHLNDNIVLTGEVGKSSAPAYADSAKGHGPFSRMFQMNDHSNEAWSVKVNAFFPSTQTRIRGAYKHLGVNYQSFSIFTDGSSQSAWSASIDQLFFHRQLDIMVGANTNDFTNPFINQEYKSTTVFKSFQATLRKRYWPVISLGYFPSSQITKLGNSQYMENLFYTLIGNVTQSYSYRGVLMNTALVYTQFYNRSSDSGFTYFNTRNLLLSHSVFLKKFTLQLNASGASNQDYRLYSLEGKVQHTLSQVLTLGAGIKYNKQTAYDIEQLGYSAEAVLRIPKLGQIQFSADKGFIPGMNSRLVPDNTGRLSYFKTF